MAATFWALIVFIIILDIPWRRGIYIQGEKEETLSKR